MCNIESDGRRHSLHGTTGSQLQRNLIQYQEDNALPAKNGRRSSSLSNESEFKSTDSNLSKNNSTPDMGREQKKTFAPVEAFKKHFGHSRADSLPRSAIRRHKKTGSNVSRVSFNLEPKNNSTLERRGSWTFERKASLINRRNSSLLSSRRPSLATADGGLADPLSSENLLLRGAKLKNTDYVYGKSKAARLAV